MKIRLRGLLELSDSFTYPTPGWCVKLVLHAAKSYCQSQLIPLFLSSFSIGLDRKCVLIQVR